MLLRLEGEMKFALLSEQRLCPPSTMRPTQLEVLGYPPTIVFIREAELEDIMDAPNSEPAMPGR